VGLGTSDWDMNLPVLAFIGRLVDQKGCPLLEKALHDILQHDVRVVALGSGANVYEDMLRGFQQRHPTKVRAIIGFDDPLAHQIEAGADMLLMPSQYEPCGLNQMYAMAYGTVPVVRAVGGLADTVTEMPGAGPGTTGFRFHEYEWRAFKEAIYRALFAYQDPPRWESIMRAGMERDDSWEHAAKDYIRIYEQALARVRG
jgi:starch synthase